MNTDLQDETMNVAGPLMPVLTNPETRWENDHREPFITIDDCILMAQELAASLDKLSHQKHPLDVRRGVVMKRGGEVECMRNINENRQIKAGSRTYFVDIEPVQDGSRKYLKITESRMKGEGKDRERNTIIVFPETAQEFANAISEMVAKLG
jgi:hypothetical protein